MGITSGVVFSSSGAGIWSPGSCRWLSDSSLSPSRRAQLLQYYFTGVEPKGTYTWMSVLTAPGALTFVSPLQQKAFVVP